ncbi:S8 family peptidase [Streptomyces sp. Tue6028]|uniref:S8 family peptidase n=1 Tax=Streptomyces sp. Tue6028 TaxID=2036037 RepID=UPI003EB87561
MRWTQLRLVLFVLAAEVLVLSVSAPGGRNAVSTASAPAAVVPGRNSSFEAMSPAQLWSVAVTPLRGYSTARPVLARPEPAEFAVGLKSSDERRGVWQSRILLTGAERTAVEEHVSATAGVSVVARDEELPVLRIRASGPEALAALRASEYVDYVEPTTVPVTVAGSGCGGSVLSAADRNTVSPGDVLPWTFAEHRVPEAWQRDARTTGKGVTIAVLDVGIIWDQTQLRPRRFGGDFDTGMSSGRQVRNLAAGHDPAWTDCEHGTRVAGLAAAPRDGVNIVGVAWQANLVTVRTAGDVIVGLGNSWWIADGIRKARDAGARIFNMAFGSVFWLSQVADRIRFERDRTDRPSVIFVGAAGTGGVASSVICPPGTTYFPSYMEEVVSVAAVNRDKRTVEPSNSCSGPDVDIAAVSEDGTDAERATETTGRTRTEIMGLGSSSGASATITGILALIWSHYPDLTADEVVARLYRSTRQGRSSTIGYGVPDAYVAVGGLGDVSLKASPQAPESGDTYRVEAVPLGDGPFTYRWSTGETTSQIERLMGDQPQRTEVTVTDVTDSHSLTTAITVLPKPCATLKEQVKAVDNDIQYLQKQIPGASTEEKRDIFAQIQSKRQERQDLLNQLASLGCR